MAFYQFRMISCSAKFANGSPLRISLNISNIVVGGCGLISLAQGYDLVSDNHSPSYIPSQAMPYTLAPHRGSQGSGQNVMDSIEYAELSARQMLAARNGDQNPISAAELLKKRVCRKSTRKHNTIWIKIPERAEDYPMRYSFEPLNSSETASWTHTEACETTYSQAADTMIEEVSKK